jgi:type I restriction enzyme S subunit
MNGWRDIKLKEVSEYVTVGFVGSMADQYVEAGVPFLRSLNIHPFRLNYNDLKYIPESFHDAIKKSKLRPGDVAIVRTGYPGTACVIPADLPDANCSDLVILRPGPDLNPYYIAAVFNSSFGQSLVGGNLVGAAQQHFNVTVAKELKLRLPPRAEQDKIAAVLVGLNDLIANNQRRIDLLESMAEEIYREWFVRMRFPGCEAATFSKGIPEGWEVVPLGRHCHVVKGRSYASEDLVDDPAAMPFVTLKSFNRGGGYRAGGLKHYKGEFKSEQLVKQGDIVMAVTDMTQDRVVVGRAARVPDLGERGAVISLDVIRLVPKKVDPTYLYLFLRFSGFANHIKEFANGANVLHLKPDLIPAQDVVMPPRALQDRVSLIAEPMLQQAEKLAQNSRRLSEMRDALLPRLISGKLRVDALNIQFPPSMQPPSEAA